MCFTKDSIFPKISYKPIKCVKVITLECGVYVTPYTLYHINFGVPIKSKKSWFKSLFKKQITSEGVHAYSKKRAVFPVWKEIVVEAIIPPFTPYWENKEKELCAAKLIITDKVIKWSLLYGEYKYVDSF